MKSVEEIYAGERDCQAGIKKGDKCKEVKRNTDALYVCEVYSLQDADVTMNILGCIVTL